MSGVTGFFTSIFGGKASVLPTTKNARASVNAGPVQQPVPSRSTSPVAANANPGAAAPVMPNSRGNVAVNVSGPALVGGRRSRKYKSKKSKKSKKSRRN